MNDTSPTGSRQSETAPTAVRSGRFDPRRWTVGLKLGVVMIVLALLPVVVLSVLGANRLRDQARSDGRTELEGVAAAVALALDTEIDANLQLIASVAIDSRVVEFVVAASAGQQPPDPAEVTDVLVGIEATHPTAGGVFLLDRDGTAIASSVPEIVGLGYDYRTYFQDALAGLTNVSEVYLPIGAPDSIPGTAFATPIRASSGEIIGVAAIKSDALTVSATLVEDGDRALFLVESTGLISSHPDLQLRFQSLVEFSDDEQAAAVAARRFDAPVVGAETDDVARSIVGARSPGFGVGTINGDELALAWHPLTSTPWVAVASRPSSEFDAPASQAFTDALSFAAIVAVIAIALAVMAALKLGRPLSLMTTAARHLGGGSGLEEDTDLKRLASRADDVGALAGQLVQTNRAIVERERRANEQLQALKVEIDQIRREAQVGEIVDSEFFSQLEARAAEMRSNRRQPE